MKNVNTQVPEQCVSAELATLEIHSLNVDSNLAPPALVVSMLNVVPMAGIVFSFDHKYGPWTIILGL